MDPVLLAQRFVQCPSVTDAANNSIAELMVEVLDSLSFETQRLPYTDLNGLSKVCLAAKRAPSPNKVQASAQQSAKAPDGRDSRSPSGNSEATGQRPIGYFCHNDVVSVAGWDCPHGGPWEGVLAEDRLWGRGACDMKGSAAAALAAIASIRPAEQTQAIYFFVTGDEESGMAGADCLVQQSISYRELVQQQGVGIIGEPTSLQLVNSHKGGCHMSITSRGVAAHSSTREGRNANWKLFPFLNYLSQVAERCEHSDTLHNPLFDPPTLSLNVVVENEPAMPNITVGKAKCKVFLRPMPDTAWLPLAYEIRDMALAMGLECHLLRPLPPVYTPPTRMVVQTMLRELQQDSPLAVSYATDGCCFQELEDLVVLGPGNIDQAHRSDEWIAIEQLHSGTDVFKRLFRLFAAEAATTTV